MDEALRWLLDTVASVDPVLRTTLAGLAIMLETSVLVGVVVPGDTVVIVAATGVTSFAEGVILAIVAIIGSLAGESMGFGIGRWLGPHLRTSRAGRWIGEKNWVRAERYVQRRGGIAIFLSRFLPVMHSLVPLTVGMSTYSYRRFLLWTLPACVIWATLYVSIAAGAAASYRQLSDTAHWAAYVFVGGILLLVVGVFAAKKVIARAERRHLND
ncbi:DedA family protein [Microbacterium rhizophilus]|uniref:DedA family protein n=1 Tax=Microbacterium rhizophilus TaxID=3138934 RepID=UPI0031F12914